MVNPFPIVHHAQIGWKFALTARTVCVVLKLLSCRACISELCFTYLEALDFPLGILRGLSAYTLRLDYCYVLEVSALASTAHLSISMFAIIDAIWLRPSRRNQTND